MNTWQEKNAALLAELAETPNPSVRGNAIGYYLRDARKDHKLTLYEQYVLETKSSLTNGWPGRSRVGPAGQASLI